jgi:hypothetical protein
MQEGDAMNLLLWNLPRRTSAREVRRFLEHELGDYVSDIEVHDAGTSHAYATATLAIDVPYIGEAMAQRLCQRRLNDEPVRARVSVLGDASTRLH